MTHDGTLEHKFARFGEGLAMDGEARIAGYASLFGQPDQGGDIVQPGAYAASLAAGGARIKMLWQHDPAQPIGIWEDVREDGRGLWVKGRLLDATQKGREAAALVQAGAIDGLSIGYRTKQAAKDGKGRRLLSELELWEVSLVTFPMMPGARVEAKAEAPAAEGGLRELAAALEAARLKLVRG